MIKVIASALLAALLAVSAVAIGAGIYVMTELVLVGGPFP